MKLILTVITLICMITVVMTVMQIIAGKTILEAFLSVLPFSGAMLLFDGLLLIIGYAAIKLKG